jgi:hypothetical protein
MSNSNPFKLIKKEARIINVNSKETEIFLVYESSRNNILSRIKTGIYSGSSLSRRKSLWCIKWKKKIGGFFAGNVIFPRIEQLNER